jgi:hypothetical protein
MEALGVRREESVLNLAPKPWWTKMVGNATEFRHQVL